MSLKTQLQSALAYCNTQLASKGVTDTATSVVDVGDKIATIQQGGGTDYMDLFLKNQSASYQNDSVTDLSAINLGAWTNLTGVIFKNATSAVGTNAFNGCTNLTFADLGSVTRLNGNAMRSSGISTLILRNSSMVVINNAGPFIGTPMVNGSGGTIYVPSAIKSTYEGNAQWQLLTTATFAVLEGSIYE